MVNYHFDIGIVNQNDKSKSIYSSSVKVHGQTLYRRDRKHARLRNLLITCYVTWLIKSVSIYIYIHPHQLSNFRSRSLTGDNATYSDRKPTPPSVWPLFYSFIFISLNIHIKHNITEEEICNHFKNIFFLTEMIKVTIYGAALVQSKMEM